MSDNLDIRPVIRTLTEIYCSLKDSVDLSLKIANCGPIPMAQRLIQAINLILQQEAEISSLKYDLKINEESNDEYNALLHGIDPDYWTGRYKDELDALCERVKRELDGED